MSKCSDCFSNLHCSDCKTTLLINNKKSYNHLLAGILSFIFPGLGQLYKGDVAAALSWFVITSIGYALFVPGLIIHLFCIIDAF